MAGVIMAGYDPVEGPCVYSIPLGGTCLKVPFALGGSGSTYIYGLVDSQWKNKQDMSLDEAREWVQQSVAHAMARDGSSGGSIRTVTVKADGSQAERTYTPGNALPFGPVGY
jgi:20S proteasome subunit beta 1